MGAVSYVSGLDLGQSADFSALAVAEVRATPGGKRYDVRHLQRWALGTPYPDIVRDVAALFRRPPLSGGTLLVDATGVGRAVLDLFRTSGIDAAVSAVTITGGFRGARGPGGWSVPKKDLVGALQVCLGTRRLQVAPALPLAKALADELAAFRVKVSAATGNESFEAWRDRDHDDLVLAVAMVAWYGERARPAATLRIYQFGAGKCRGLKIVACSRGELGALEIDPKHPCLLITIADPPPEGGPPCVPAEWPAYPFHAVDALALAFADLDPDAPGLRERWAEPLAPWGRTPDQLALTREQGKKLWSFILRHRDPPPDVFVFADEGERRALSVALAVCDALHLPRPEAIHRPAEEGWQATRDEAPPNRYVFEVVKATRALVVGECVTRWGTAPRPGADGWKTLPRCWGRGW